MNCTKIHINNLPFSNELKEKLCSYINYSEWKKSRCALVGCPENIVKIILVTLASELGSNIRFVDCRNIKKLKDWLKTVAKFQENDVVVLLYTNQNTNIIPFIRNSIFASHGFLRYFVVADSIYDIHFELWEAIHSTIDLSSFKSELSQFYVSNGVNGSIAVDQSDYISINEVDEMISEADHLSIDEIDKMNGREFELFTGDLLIKLGFTDVGITSLSGDFGADVIAEKDDIKYAIQCKRYSKPVGISAIQEVIASKSLYDCHVACVLTNNNFTPAAEELAKKNFVVLWGRKKLQEFIDKTQ